MQASLPPERGHPNRQQMLDILAAATSAYPELEIFPPRYVDEFSFRLNEGNDKLHTLTRLNSFVAGTSGKRLTYKDLIA